MRDSGTNSPKFVAEEEGFWISTNFKAEYKLRLSKILSPITEKIYIINRAYVKHIAIILPWRNYYEVILERGIFSSNG